MLQAFSPLKVRHKLDSKECHAIFFFVRTDTVLAKLLWVLGAASKERGKAKGKTERERRWWG